MPVSAISRQLWRKTRKPVIVKIMPTESLYNPYFFLVVFVLVAVVFPLIPIALARLWFFFFSPLKPGASKSSIYESGVKSSGDAWVQFKVQYYLYALLFLIFDVEVVFLMPLAVAFSGLSPVALVSVLIFILLLGESLVWAWSKGHLEWS